MKFDKKGNPEILFSIERDGAAGVYTLWAEGECVYVGQTQNIFQRMMNHWNRKFDRVTFIPCLHMHDRLNLEERMIKILKPRWNVNLIAGRLSEDRRCKPGGARGRDLSGDRYANHRLLMSIAIEKAGTQKALSAIITAPPHKVSHWRRTGDIPEPRRKQIEGYVGMSVDVVATFISENAAPDPWRKREYFDGDFEDKAA